MQLRNPFLHAPGDVQYMQLPLHGEEKVIKRHHCRCCWMCSYNPLPSPGFNLPACLSLVGQVPAGVMAVHLFIQVPDGWTGSWHLAGVPLHV